MRLRTQIVLKLLLIIVLLFAIYMVVLAIIFEFYYKPDVLDHFKEELESVHAFRTSNMTVSISSRFEAFDRLTNDNVGKMKKLLDTIYTDEFDPVEELPFIFTNDETYEEHCTSGVKTQDQALMKNLEPLWLNTLKLKLGWQTNLSIYTILVLYKGEGICAFYNDPEVQKDRMALMNELPSSSFTHSVFADESDTRRHIQIENELFGDINKTFGIWNEIKPDPEKPAEIALTIQYDIDGLDKMMPQFVDQLKVPLIAISDSRSFERIYFSDTSQGKHFEDRWDFSEQGFQLDQKLYEKSTFF